MKIWDPFINQSTQIKILGFLIGLIHGGIRSNMIEVFIDKVRHRGIPERRSNFRIKFVSTDLNFYVYVNVVSLKCSIKDASALSKNRSQIVRNEILS